MGRLAGHLRRGEHSKVARPKGPRKGRRGPSPPASPLTPRAAAARAGGAILPPTAGGPLTRRPKKKLGELLREAKLLSEEDLARGLAAQQATGERLGSTLLRLQLVDAPMLSRILADQLDVEGVDPDRAEPTPEALALVPEQLAFRLGCLPLQVTDGQLELAIADPTDRAALDRVAQAAGLPVRPLVAPQMALFRALKRVYAGLLPADRSALVRQHLAEIRRLVGEVERLLGEGG